MRAWSNRPPRIGSPCSNRTRPAVADVLVSNQGRVWPRPRDPQEVTMAAKPSLRRPLSAALAASTVILVLGASSALAATGSVYVDANGNAAAGHTLFNGSFTGDLNTGLGYQVLDNLTHWQQQRRGRLQSAGQHDDRLRQRRDRARRARMDQRQDGQRNRPAGRRQRLRATRDRASSRSLDHGARRQRRAVDPEARAPAAPDRAASQAGKGRLIKA